MKYCVIFDIDGTIADISNRLSFIESTPKDWDSFYNNLINDKPIKPTILLLKNVIKAYPVFFCTGRPERYRQDTISWIQENCFKGMLSPEKLQYDLLMRKSGDRRPDYIIKKEFLNNIIKGGFTPLFAIEDRSRVVKMYRDSGITCLQCAEGDY